MSLSMDFFFVPRLKEDSDRGKRDRNAGVEVFCGGGCGKSGEVADENGGYEASCNGKKREKKKTNDTCGGSEVCVRLLLLIMFGVI